MAFCSNTKNTNAYVKASGAGVAGGAGASGCAGVGAGVKGAHAKHEIKDMRFRADAKRQRRNKATLFINIALVLFLIALLSGIGSTVCALSASAKHKNLDQYFDGKLIENSKSTHEKDAYPGYSEPRKAIAKNNGSLPMYVRMSYKTYWCEKNSSGKWVRSSDKSLNSSYIEVEVTNDSSWFDGGDGWYYYKKQIAPGAKSSSLLKKVTLSTEIGEENNTDSNHAVASEYIGKAAGVDVKLQCTAEVPEKDKKGGSDAKGAFAPKTGDSLPTFAILLGAIAVLALLAAIIFLIASRHKSRRGNDGGSGGTGGGAGSGGAGGYGSDVGRASSVSASGSAGVGDSRGGSCCSVASNDDGLMGAA